MLEITFDLIKHLHRQQGWSIRTFGPARGYKGVINHIRKEMDEIEEKPTDLEEWIDVMILAFDGAYRATGATPEQICRMIEKKQTKNEGRQWPDWRNVDPDKAIEHIR